MANSNEVKLTELHEVCAAANHEALNDMMIAGKHDNNIDYKDPDWDERAPLHWCAIRGRSDMLRKLLEKGAHPGVRSANGWTAAHYAAEGGKLSVLRALHSFHAPMDRVDLGGDTPRRIAEVYGQREAESYLKQAEADYKTRRRKLELNGDLEPGDDEDLLWCNQNKVTPIKYISEAEYEELMAEPEIIPQPKPKPKKKSSKEDLGSPVVNKKKEVTISLNDNVIKPSKENVVHQSKRSKSSRKK